MKEILGSYDGKNDNERKEKASMRSKTARELLRMEKKRLLREWREIERKSMLRIKNNIHFRSLWFSNAYVYEFSHISFDLWCIPLNTHRDELNSLFLRQKINGTKLFLETQVDVISNLILITRATDGSNFNLDIFRERYMICIRKDYDLCEEKRNGFSFSDNLSNLFLDEKTRKEKREESRKFREGIDRRFNGSSVRIFSV